MSRILTTEWYSPLVLTRHHSTSGTLSCCRRWRVQKPRGIRGRERCRRGMQVVVFQRSHYKGSSHRRGGEQQWVEISPTGSQPYRTIVLDTPLREYRGSWQAQFRFTKWNWLLVLVHSHPYNECNIHQHVLKLAIPCQNPQGILCIVWIIVILLGEPKGIIMGKV